LEILSIIPARGGSKGIPQKNLVRLGGRPLLYYTVKASLDSIVNRTIVTTDNEKIADYAERCGSQVITRPKKLANDKISIEPAIKHVLDKLNETEGYIPDVIVLLQNTSPLRTSKHINDALDLFKKNNFDSVLSGYISHSLLWKKKDRFAVPLNYNPLKRPNRQQMKNQFIENGAIYVTKYNLFKKTNCRISGKIGLFEMPQELSLQIDSLSDLSNAEQVLKWRGSK
jgi:CMP-N,N'-diacetyllegionaminic acid synthase